MLKNAIFAALIEGALFFSPASLAGTSGFSGEWEYVEFLAGSTKPYLTFDINLTETSDGNVVGAYCFVTQEGNRIDCDPGGTKNIHGFVTNDGRHANVDFDSFFGAKAGSAYLSRYENTLIWKVVKNPTGDFFYGPYSATLRKKQPNAQKGERQVVVDRAYLYPTPATSETKIYLVRGDFVKLINISDDLKFWKISFSEKDGKKIDRWLNCDAVDFCP